MNLAALLGRPVQPLDQDQDKSDNMKDDSGEPHQGTPNDVRMFPVKRGASSQSIPIANVEVSPSELQLHEDELQAEFREYRMYRRIVTGMKAKSLESDQLKDHTWQHTPAKESLDNVILARDPRFVPDQQQHHHGHLGIVTPDMQIAYNSSYATTRTYDHMMMMPPGAAEVSNHDDFLEEDEGIFELEL
jgi:hypothetical protein